MLKAVCKKINIKILAVVIVLGGIITSATEVYAVEQWNDASVVNSDSEAEAWTTWKKEWKAVSSDYEKVSLTPGSDEKKINFAWYSHTEEIPVVKISKSENMNSSIKFKGKQTKIMTVGLEEYYSNKVTVNEINENTTYYYQVLKNGKWSEINKYTAKSFSNYSILYVGDPQIGACKNQISAGEGITLTESGDNLAARNDAYNWKNILNNAVNNHNVSFMISAGDQVNTAGNEKEYAGYLGADALTSLPAATTIGSHDNRSVQYTYHFNNPNAFSESQTEFTAGASVAGTDYYYTYGDALFIVLDTKNQNCTTHKNVISKAVNENEDVKWRIVTMHEDVYGTGANHSDSDGIILRTQLTTIFDEFDIDVVLQGHDHTYSRTYQLKSDGKEHKAFDATADVTSDEFINENKCYDIVRQPDMEIVADPDGTVYFDANSSTGSKYYDLITTQQDYISERSQKWTPSYSVINISENALSVITYDATTGCKLEGSSTYTIVKKADRNAILKGIEFANTLIKEKNNYTKNSISLLTKAKNRAEAVYNNELAEKNDIDKSVSQLSNAFVKMNLKTEQIISIETDRYIKARTSNGFNIRATNSGNGCLSYKSSNTNVAMVNSEGRVSIKGVGKAIITIKAAKTNDEKSSNKKVTVIVVPGKAVISSVKSQTAEKIDVTWKKNSGADGYVIKYSTDKKMKRNVLKVIVKGSKVTKKTIDGLISGKKYYITLSAYISIDGKKCYGNASNVKSVKCK